MFLFLGRAVKQVSPSTSNESHHKNNKFAVGGSNEHRNNTNNITNINTTHNNKQLKMGRVRKKIKNGILISSINVLYFTYLLFITVDFPTLFLILIGKWIFFDSTFFTGAKGYTYGMGVKN